MRSRPRWLTRAFAASSSMWIHPAARSAVCSTWSTRSARSRRSGKPLWAVANEDALSAAYAIASAADRLYVTRTGEVGSIGVVAVHVDESGADAQAGSRLDASCSRAQQKVDGNAHEPLSQRARDDDPGRRRSPLRASSARWLRPIADLTVEAVRAARRPRSIAANSRSAPDSPIARHARPRDRRDGGRARSRDSAARRTDQIDTRKEHVHGDERD